MMKIPLTKEQFEMFENMTQAQRLQAFMFISDNLNADLEDFLRVAAEKEINGTGPEPKGLLKSMKAEESR